MKRTRAILAAALLAVSAVGFSAGTASAAVCNGHVAVTIYRDAGYTGPSKTFCSDVSNLDSYPQTLCGADGSLTWNDCASSILITGSPTPNVCFYRDAGPFTGEALKSVNGADFHDLIDSPFPWVAWNDQISAINIGC